ncbi:MAG: hypothetical protein QM737_08150 [Ferruginibacter sp.]
MTDDSEDIFRRAAESYPLKTDNPDWDAVRKKMEAGGAVPEEIPVSKKRKKRWLLLLLLLLAFSVIEYTYSPLSNLFRSEKHEQTGKSQPVAAKPTEENKAEATTENNPTGNNTAGNKELTTDAVATTQTAVPTKDLNKVNTVTVDPAVAKQENNTASTTTITAANQTASLTHDVTPGKPGTTKTKQATTAKKDNNRFKNNDAGEKTNLAHNGKRITSKQKSRFGIKNAEATGDDENKTVSAVETDPKEKTTAIVAEPEASKVPADTDKSVVKEEPATKKTIADSVKAIEKEIAKTTDKTNDKDKDEKKKKQHQKHFYVGIMAVPDLSLIKMQSVKKMGVSFGLIAGYQINKRLSIETGFFKDEKKYCSDGKYFSTKKIQTYPNSKITYISGTCYMYEIPLNVSYTFRQKKASTMFASAGISSYLMNKEDYDYDVKYYNTIYPYSKEYRSKDNQFVAVVNISAGYTHRLGKIGDVRIEPYLKLPVNKVGTGDLPIQSFGIMVGFTRKLF